MLCLRASTQSLFNLGARFAAVALLAAPVSVMAQAQPVVDLTSGLDSLVSLALRVNPAVQAAAQRAEAVRAGIETAGTLDDPMLGVGIMNFPVTEPGFSDFMTMTTVSIGQRLPYPGKLGLARQAATLDLRAAEARLEMTRRDVMAEVREAYYDLAFLDRSLEVIEDNQKLLLGLVQVTESRYAVGTSSQQEVLRARVETANLAEEAVAVTEGRRAALARLNALLDRSSATPVEEPRIPERVALAAVPASPQTIQFASGALGARALDSPLPPLDEMQERAIRNSPLLRAHGAEVMAQAARLELANRAHLPDLDLSLQYGYRVNNGDLMSVMVSASLPIHRGARQDQEVAGAQAELAALEAGHHGMLNEVRSEVARQYSELERDRAQLALLVKSVVPQGRAVLEAATAAFQVGREDFPSVIESQAALYDYELAQVRSLAEFAKGLAELERIVGGEVLP